MKIADETKESITLHGLGFLQVKLQGGQRLHVWHPDLPRRTCFAHSAIHDHSFSFMSTVLVGTQINHDYDVEVVGDYESFNIDTPATHISYLHEGSRTQYGNRPWLAHQLLKVTKYQTFSVRPGCDYSISAYAYHSTEPGGDGRVATIMKKTYEGPRGAHSLCEVGHDPDVNFDRKQWSEEKLWAIVRNVLGQSTFASQW